MPLSTEVGLDPDDTVLNEDPAPSMERGTTGRKSLTTTLRS